MQTIRLFFKKTKDAKFLSHLDVMRCFTRAIKRSGLPVWYTEGFNTHIYLLFGSPISLGFESEYETVELRLTQACNVEDYLPVINAGLPEGIDVFHAAEPKFNYKEIAFSQWEIELSCPGAKELKKDFFAFLDQETILTTKKTKKGIDKEIDIKPLIRKISVSEEASGLIIDTILANSSDASLNPRALLQAFFDSQNEPLFWEASFRRKKLFTGNLDVFE